MGKNQKKITVKQVDIEKTISKISNIPELTISNQEWINLQKLESAIKESYPGFDTDHLFEHYHLRKMQVVYSLN